MRLKLTLSEGMASRTQRSRQRAGRRVCFMCESHSLWHISHSREEHARCYALLLCIFSSK